MKTETNDTDVMYSCVAVKSSVIEQTSEKTETPQRPYNVEVSTDP